MSNNLALYAMLAAIAIAASLHSGNAQKIHVVGDSLGWIVPPGGPIAYSTWADLQVFSVGDILCTYSTFFQFHILLFYVFDHIKSFVLGMIVDKWTCPIEEFRINV